MANAVLDARQEGDSYRRIEVITGQSRRRRWTRNEKARIVAESFETDANISEVARRHGVARGLLTAWRRQVAAAARSRVPSFVPVQIDAEESGRGAASEPDHALPAQTRLLEKASLRREDLDLVEMNEAFAAQVLACNRELGLDPERLNVNGGAIALGHPIGATGARIAVTLLHEMARRKVRRGLATLCISGGMGLAAAFEAA